MKPGNAVRGHSYRQEVAVPLTSNESESSSSDIVQRDDSQALNESAQKEEAKSPSTVFKVAETLPTSSRLVAGSSLLKSAESYLEKGEAISIKHSWDEADFRSFQLRVGPNYKWYKLKAPSPPPFYSVVGFDFVRCSSKIDNIGSRVSFPPKWLEHEEQLNGILPSLFIVNVQLPSDFSSPLFGEITDGDGWSLVLYFKISEAVVEVIRRMNKEPLPPTLSLLHRYCQEAPLAYQKYGSNGQNPWVGRFKIILRVENIEKFGLPSFITQYNAKPVLIRTTGSLMRDKSYIEMDINVHRFNSVPKKGLQVMFDRFDNMVIAMGFCLESREDIEMPETLIGCASLLRPTPTWATAWTE